jgi:hypothetical protein
MMYYYVHHIYLNWILKKYRQPRKIKNKVIFSFNRYTLSIENPKYKYTYKIEPSYFYYLDYEKIKNDLIYGRSKTRTFK